MQTNSIDYVTLSAVPLCVWREYFSQTLNKNTEEEDRHEDDATGTIEQDTRISTRPPTCAVM